MNKLRFAKLEVGLQSNNRYHNIPSIILTVSGCNLKCIEDGELCKYAYPDKNKHSVEDARKFIERNKSINHIVIQGGEPLYYKEGIEKFLNEIWRDDLVITIHTNGTLPILNPLTNKYKVALYVVSISNKNLPTPGTKIVNPINKKDFVFGTTDVELMQPININSLRNICLYSNDYLLSFKCEPEKLVEFSNKIIKEICNSDDEFLNRFLENHPPQNHIVFTPRTKKEEEKVKRICFNTGKPFNNYKEI